MSEFPDFQPYLKSICDRYQKWWQLYTLTDAAGKERQSKSELQSPFDFGLMVQTVRKENRDPRNEEKERIERFPVLEGIRKYAKDFKHVLLVGRPGAGKSTTLARLLLEEATQQTSLPVLVELRYWQGSIEQLILNSFARHDLPLTVDQLETVLSRCLILFDGVNELPSEEARIQLSAFRRNHPKVPMIFTTRDLSFGGDLGIEKRLEMQPLTETQMQVFIRSYVPEQAEQMLWQLKDRLREFGQIPLLLWMLCQLFQQTGEIPDNLGMVFRLFTQGYERNLKQDVVIESDRAWWKPVLQQLAWVMMQGEKPTEFRVAISREEAVRAIAQFLDGKVPYAEDFARKCLRDLQKYHLIQAGMNEELEFRHQLIYEYYVAEALLEWLPILNDEILKSQYLNYLKWTEPVALMMALIDSKAQALRVVKLAMEVDLILGARLAGETQPKFHIQTIALINSIEISSNLRIELLIRTRSEKIIPDLINVLQKVIYHELNPIAYWERIDQKLYERTAGLLGRLGSKEIFSKMKDVLQDEASFLHCFALDVLGHLGDKAAVPELIKALHNTDPRLRREAAIALGKLKHEAALSELLYMLEFDEDAGARAAAALALEELGKEAVPGLLKALHDSSAWVRRCAVRAVVGLCGDNETVAPLLIELIHDEDANVFHGMVGTLKQLDSKAVLRKAVFLETLKSLQSCKVTTRANAAEALGILAEPEGASGLLEALHDVEAAVRRNAVKALSELGDEQVLPELLRALNDEDCSVRVWTARILGELGSKEAVPQLLEALHDVESDVHEVAVQALGKLRGEAAISELLEIMQDDNTDVRARAVEALGELGGHEAIPQLLEALRDVEPDVREAAAEALGKVKSDSTVMELIRLLEDEQSSVRRNVVEALGKLGNETAIPKLMKTVQNDNNRRVRFCALQALVEINAEVALPIILQALEVQDFDLLDTPNLPILEKPDVLPRLWQCVKEIHREFFVLDIITAIQRRSKFYNYDIYQGGRLFSLRTKTEDRIEVAQNQMMIGIELALTLFYSYSHKDETLRDELNKHLKLLQRQGIIDAWYDRDITAGTDWAEAIDTHLNTADIILLLISADFLASDYCYETEMQRALERHNHKEARVIPIILRECDWTSAPFGKLQALPIAHSAGAKAVTSWNNQDEAFTAIAQGIRRAAEAIRKERLV